MLMLIRNSFSLYFTLIGLIGSILLLGGCANVHTTLEHPQTHLRQTCQAWGWGVIGAPLALLARYECVKNLKQAGYVEIDDKRRKASK